MRQSSQREASSRVNHRASQPVRTASRGRGRLASRHRTGNVHVARTTFRPDAGAMPHDDDVAAPAAAAAANAAAPAGEGALLWAPGPGEREHARVAGFIRWLAARGIHAAGYDELWRWSVERPGDFWDSVWAFFHLPGRRGHRPAVTCGPRSPRASGPPAGTAPPRAPPRRA